MKNVAVFFGGNSVEHDISIITGVTTLNALDRTKYNPIPIYVHNDGTWYTGSKLFDLDGYKNLQLKSLQRVTIISGLNALYLVKGKKIKQLCVLSVAINCMHGERGEDGSLSGLLNMCAIPVASPDVLPSSVCMDKCFTKTVLKGLKIKALPSITVESDSDIKRVKEKFKFPIIVKPACSGSSIGIRVADDEKELESAITYALKFGNRAIVEPCLKKFLEINCAAYKDSLGNVRVSECERPVGRTELLTFSDKYKSGKRIFPADVEREISDKIKAVTEKVYAELNFDGVIRIDYFVCEDTVYLNEINTVPGSLAYYLFGNTLKEFTNMLTELIIAAERKGAKQSTVLTNFNSGILGGAGAKGNKAKG